MNKSNDNFPPSLFSRSAERDARMEAWATTWRTKKRMLFAFYAIDTITAIIRAVFHTILWIPAIVMWPLLLSSNGITPPMANSWLTAVAHRGWDGALLMLSAAVFLLSMAIQFAQGGLGQRMRKHLDRHADMSIVWAMIQDVIPKSEDQTLDNNNNNNNKEGKKEAEKKENEVV